MRARKELCLRFGMTRLQERSTVRVVSCNYCDLAKQVLGENFLSSPRGPTGRRLLSFIDQVQCEDSRRRTGRGRLQ